MSESDASDDISDIEENGDNTSEEEEANDSDKDVIIAADDKIVNTESEEKSVTWQDLVNFNTIIR